MADHVYDPRHVDRQLGCVAIMKALAEIDPAIAAQLSRRQAAPPQDVKANETRATRTAKAGGVVLAGGGVAGEAGNLLTASKEVPALPPAENFMPAWVCIGLIGGGLAIALIAAVVARRRLAFLSQKWSGA